MFPLQVVSCKWAIQIFTVIYVVSRGNQDNLQNQQDSCSGCSQRVGLVGRVSLFLSLAVDFELQHGWGREKELPDFTGLRWNALASPGSDEIWIKAGFLALLFSDPSQSTVNFKVKCLVSSSFSRTCTALYSVKHICIPPQGLQPNIVSGVLWGSSLPKT